MKKKREIFFLLGDEMRLRLKKMKLTVLLTFLVMASFGNSFSQVTLSIHFDKANIHVVLSSIEKKTDYIFMYKDNILDESKEISVDFRDAKFEDVLKSVCEQSNVDYEVRQRQIILKEKAVVPKPLVEQQQQKKELSGTVKDSQGLPLPGVTIYVKGTTNGTITDNDGNFRLSVPTDAKILVFSFIGMKTQEFLIAGKTTFNVNMSEALVAMAEVVAVGYGVQKKASVVGAITTTTSKELQRSGGVNNIGMALTGKLAGVTTLQNSGQPGKEDPIIFIRGQGTWNGGQPYILVDGVERKMNDLDMSEVDNISVLKDASATAVYGVKGANGVILINTKRGAKGKPQLSISANSTLKYPSRLMDKLDSYDTYMVKNFAIEREVSLMEGMWADYTPLAIAQRYRNQQNLKYPEAYPNVDWQKETIKDFTMDHRVNVNVSGGTDFAKYFSSLAYNSQGDLMKIRDNGRGITPGFGYDKFNFRTNLDLNLTKTTSLKFNLAGVYSMLKSQRSLYILDYTLVAQYALPANAYLPQYADGRWGQSPNTDLRMSNSSAYMANTGYDQTNATDLTSDLGFTQKLDFVTQGLSASANLSFDNHFESVKSITDGDLWPTKYINPAIEDMPVGGDPSQYIILGPVAGTNQFPYVQKPWILNDENADNRLSTLRRRLYYQAQLIYARTFNKHDFTATGVFTREQLATGSEFQRYREDWIFRTTYNYNGRYFAEFNGAYNGSEKFGVGYRFAFFPSGAIGWTISNEKFLKGTESWLDKLKLRYSYGRIGDDGGLSQRWMYETQWTAVGSSLPLTEYASQTSPYKLYKEGAVGNPDIHWETAKKSNLGLEIAVLKNTFSANLEYFNEDRTGILLLGSSRIVPPYFGAFAPTGNVGRVVKKGYELEFKFNKTLNECHLWAEASMTHAVDEVMEKEEPALKDPHLLAKGFQIDQTRSMVSTGYIQTWDHIYASTLYGSQDAQKLPGNYFIIDFNSDGVIDAKDSAPYGYSNRPQNNYNLSLGADYKGFSVMLQLYGVNNVTRLATFDNFVSNIDIAYAHTLDHWSKENPNGSSPPVRWKTSGQSPAQYFLFDGSYLRLKTAELAYNFTGSGLKQVGISSLKLYLNGNNLLFWSKLPDDREIGSERFGTYPTTKRINLGVDIKF